MQVLKYILLFLDAGGSITGLLDYFNIDIETLSEWFNQVGIFFSGIGTDISELITNISNYLG